MDSIQFSPSSESDDDESVSLVEIDKLFKEISVVTESTYTKYQKRKSNLVLQSFSF